MTSPAKSTRKVPSSERHGNTTMIGCKSCTFDGSVTNLNVYLFVIRDEFEKAIIQEEKDRIQYHEDSLNPVRA